MAEEKFLLSIEEASRRYGIGRHRLREIMKEDDPGNLWHLNIGRVIRIKREAFDEHIRKTGSL